MLSYFVTMPLDLFSDKNHAGSPYTEREVMVLGEQCERLLERLTGDYGVVRQAFETEDSGVCWDSLRWMRRERDSLMASRIDGSLADDEPGDKRFQVSFMPILSSPYWMDDYNWFLQRTRNILDLGNVASYFLDFDNLSIVFKSELDAASYRTRLDALKGCSFTAGSSVLVFTDRGFWAERDGGLDSIFRVSAA